MKTKFQATIQIMIVIILFGIFTHVLFTTPAYAANLISNPGCEGNTNGWSGWQATVTLNTSVAHSDNSSCNVQQTTGAVFTMYASPDPVSNPQIGQAYTTSAWVRSSASIGKPLWLAIKMRGGAEPDDTIYSPLSVNSSTTWQQLTNTVSVDYPDRTSLGIYIAEDPAPSGTDSFQVDDVSLQLVGAPTPTPTPVATGDLQGFFSADQNFIVEGTNNCAIGSDLQLSIAGAVVVNAGQTATGGTFQQNRNLCANNSTLPAVSFIERPDMILNAPALFKIPNYRYTEVAP